MDSTTFKQVYQKHKISPERRKFTHRVINSLKTSKEKSIKEGNVYCIRYSDDSMPTDKWHQLSLFFVTEVKKTEICGYNLLYQGREASYNLLHHNLMYRLEKHVKEEVVTYSLKEYRNSETQRRVNNEFTVEPWSHAYKVFKAEKIVKFATVQLEDWPFVPLVELNLFGDLNPYFLMLEWKKENSLQAKKKAKIKKEELLETEEYVFDDLDEDNSLEKIDTSTVLSDVKDDILDDDGDDI
jgi:hypothetical protein